MLVWHLALHVHSAKGFHMVSRRHSVSIVHGCLGCNKFSKPNIFLYAQPSSATDSAHYLRSYDGDPEFFAALPPGGFFTVDTYEVCMLCSGYTFCPTLLL